MGRLRRPLGLVALSLALLLLTLNFYGLTRDLRPDGLEPDNLRFGERDVPTAHSDFRAGIERHKDENESGYAARLTQVIADGLAHVHWTDFQPDRFHQRVPVWENYILYLMGVLTPIPEFERYHFSSPEKSMERGIGICGDASILMSQLLSREGIENEIITLPGHVVVEASVAGGRRLFDPDFGVDLGVSAERLLDEPASVIARYEANGFARGEVGFLRQASEQGYGRWQGPQHFIMKKFYFEKVAYVMKWAVPASLVLIAVLLLFGLPRKKRDDLRVVR